jgi:hypothetical protein
MSNRFNGALYLMKTMRPGGAWLAAALGAATDASGVATSELEFGPRDAASDGLVGDVGDEAQEASTITAPTRPAQWRTVEHRRRVGLLSIMIVTPRI